MDVLQLIQTMLVMKMQSADDKTGFPVRTLMIMIVLGMLMKYQDTILQQAQNICKRWWMPAAGPNFKGQVQATINFHNSYRRGSQNTLSEQMTAVLWKFQKQQELFSQDSSYPQAYSSMEILSFTNTKLSHESWKENRNLFCRSWFVPLTDQWFPMDKDVMIQFNVTNDCQQQSQTNSKNNGSDKDNNKNCEIDPNDIDVDVVIVVASIELNTTQLQDWLLNNSRQYQQWYESHANSKINIYFSRENSKNSSSFMMYGFQSTKTFDTLFFKQKDMLINRLNQYQQDISKYQKLGIPHTLGLMLHGQPGCGKTSCIKAIANFLKRDVICVNFAHIDSVQDLRELFMSNQVSFNSYQGGPYVKAEKRIYVFEEIDCCLQDTDNPFLDRALVKQLYEQRQQETARWVGSMRYKSEEVEDKSVAPKDSSSSYLCKGPKVTLGEILELLDGIAENSDRIIIFTTNAPERLDKALLRPGRVDMILEFGKLRKVDVNNLYKLWFDEDIPDDVMQALPDDNLITQANFGKLCFDHAHDKQALLAELVKLSNVSATHVCYYHLIHYHYLITTTYYLITIPLLLHKQTKLNLCNTQGILLYNESFVLWSTRLDRRHDSCCMEQAIP